MTATLVAPMTYDLSGLLRGQAGTDAALALLVPSGSPFVLLDTSIAPISLTSAETRLPLNWRYGPASRGIGDAAYATAPHTFQALALRPLSPVRIKGQRAANGDLTLTWIRRTRIGGDSWDLTEVPLSEDAERYEADILAGTAVKRTIAATTPSLVYSAASQLADFGSLQSSITLRLAQVSGSYGRGAAASASV